MKTIKITGVVACFLMVFIFSCKKQEQVDSTLVKENARISNCGSNNSSDNSSARVAYNTFYGPVTQMGNGTARSWINISKNNIPLAIGIEMTHGALQNLPTDPMDHEAATYLLKLHQKAHDLTAFDHIVLNWEPEGHEPNGIYSVPHFDMHFYTISTSAQMAITSLPTASPAAGYLPASYVIQAATIAGMGTHWIDPSSPELPPTFQPFTHTFIYGSNNGGVIFMEPMITRAFLMSGTSVTKPFPQSTLFAESTYYPSTYNIWMEGGKHYISLSDFSLK